MTIHRATNLLFHLQAARTHSRDRCSVGLLFGAAWALQGTSTLSTKSTSMRSTHANIDNAIARDEEVERERDDRESLQHERRSSTRAFVACGRNIHISTRNTRLPHVREAHSLLRVAVFSSICSEVRPRLGSRCISPRRGIVRTFRSIGEARLGSSRSPPPITRVRRDHGRLCRITYRARGRRRLGGCTLGGSTDCHMRSTVDALLSVGWVGSAPSCSWRRSRQRKIPSRADAFASCGDLKSCLRALPRTAKAQVCEKLRL